MIFLLLLEIIIFVFCLAILLLFTLEFIAIFTTVAPFVPIPKHVENAIITHLKLGDSSVLYDLGCGDGRILIKATEKHPTITAVGIEKSWRPYLLARLKTKHSPVIIRRADFFNTNLSDATHIFVYLFPKALDELFPILHTQCTPGTRIVSCDFQAQKFTPTEVIEIDESASRGKRLFVYTV